MVEGVEGEGQGGREKSWAGVSEKRFHADEFHVVQQKIVDLQMELEAAYGESARYQSLVKVWEVVF